MLKCNYITGEGRGGGRGGEGRRGREKEGRRGGGGTDGKGGRKNSLLHAHDALQWGKRGEEGVSGIR